MKYLLLAAAIFSHNSYASDWYFVAYDIEPNITYYIDIDSIQADGTLRKAKKQIVYESMEDTPYGFVKYKFVDFDVDCADHSMKMMRGVYYSEDQQALVTLSLETDGRLPIKPKTVGAEILLTMCDGARDKRKKVSPLVFSGWFWKMYHQYPEQFPAP